LPLDSPRVYASSFGPYDTPTVWNVLTTTIDEYVHYFSTLADPGQSSKRALASIFKKTNAHSSKSLGDSNGASSSRGKAGDDEATKLKKRSSRVVDDSEESEEEDLKMNKELAAQFHVRTILEGRLPAVKAAKIVRRHIYRTRSFFRSQSTDTVTSMNPIGHRRFSCCES
jgi:hypothetical protein